MTQGSHTPAEGPPPAEPPRDCPLCPRLVDYRRENQRAHPEWFNGPAPSFGDPGARLLIVGLAPGRQGANRTGRPFTGDFAGILLYETLLSAGFARGAYHAHPADGLELIDCMITNAVRCAPPANAATPVEQTTCRPFLAARIASLPRLKVILTLGDVARASVVRALGRPVAAAPRGHASEARLGPYRLINSFHCSRLNTNTGRLTPAMFEAVVLRARELMEEADPPQSSGA